MPRVYRCLLLLFGMSTLCQTASTAPEEHWQQLCKEVEHVKMPDADRPSAGAKQALAHCDSADLYYGITRPADPVKARQCAFLEMGPDESVFGGRNMLMMVYANGKGATRNFDVAIKMACETVDSPDEIRMRVEHLDQLKGESWHGHDFDVCHDFTGSLMSGSCASLQERFKEHSRAVRLEAILSKWSVEDRQAFRALQKADDEFVESAIRLEVDLSGTLSGCPADSGRERAERGFRLRDRAVRTG